MRSADFRDLGVVASDTRRGAADHPRFHTDSRRLHDELRTEYGPVVPVELPDGIRAWLVIGYRELHQVLRESTLFSRNRSLWSQWGNIPPDWPMLAAFAEPEPPVFYTDAARHAPYARLVETALETVDPFALRHSCEMWADRLIDEFCGRGDADLVPEFAETLPILVLARVIGFGDEESPDLARTMKTMVAAAPESMAANQRFAEDVTRLLTTRARCPMDDVVSAMLRHPAPFTEVEYIRNLQTMLATGHLATADWLVNSLGLMLTDDRFASALGGGRRSIAQAMNEVLWEDAPSQIVPRWVARDTRLAGTAVRAGDLLLLSLVGANADPHVRQHWGGHEDPAHRGDNNAHFAFGYGEYRCPFPAQQMAEIIARTGIEVLLDRLPDLDLAIPATDLTRRPSPFLCGLVSLPVRFTPVRPVGPVRP